MKLPGMVISAPTAMGKKLFPGQKHFPTNVNTNGAPLSTSKSSPSSPSSSGKAGPEEKAPHAPPAPPAGHSGAVVSTAPRKSIKSATPESIMQMHIEPPVSSETIMTSVGLLLLGFICGSLRMNLFWPLIVGVFIIAYHVKNGRYLDPWKTYAIQMGLMENPDLLRKLMDTYPTWIQFPEFEKALWVNRMLQKLWPYYSKAIEDMMIPMLNPILEMYKPPIPGEFAIYSFELGDVPPIVTGMKTNLTNAEEVVIDLSFEFNSEAVIKLKVATIIAKLSQLRVKGKLRLVLAPLVEDFPCAAGVSVSFVEKPLIDFKFEAAKLNVMGVPGLSDMIIDVLKYQLAWMIIWPKKMFFPLRNMSEEEVKRNSEASAAGAVSFTVCEAKGLPKMDKFGLSDPYCVVHLGAKSLKTKVMHKNLNPVWNQTFDFEVFDYDNDKFVVEVFDEDKMGSDDIIGSFEIPVRRIGDHHEHWYHIPPATGSVLIKASYNAFTAEFKEMKSDKPETPRTASNRSIASSNAPSDTSANPPTNSNGSNEGAPAIGSSNVNNNIPEDKEEDSTSSISQGSAVSLNTAQRNNAQASSRSLPGDGITKGQFYVFLKIISADNLPTNILGMNLETYVSAQLDDQYYESKVSKRSSHPTWDEEFKFTTKDLKNAELQLAVLNHHTLKSDSKFATAQLALHEIPFNIFVRESLELTFVNQKKSEKAKGDPPVLKVKLKVSPTQISSAATGL
jgi:hypothetical protein